MDFSIFDYKNLKLYYFIGRLNPPHIGHIAALRTMIAAANEDHSHPIILLGSGPNGGERTLDNPIPFETKEMFLRTKLVGLQFTVWNMNNSVENLRQWYSTVMAHKPEDVETESVEMIRFAGDKGDNATKLSFLDKHLVKLSSALTSKTVAVEAVSTAVGEEMSATIVRKFAYQCYLKDRQDPTTGLDLFVKEYGRFYREYSEQIYGDIIEPALTLSNGEIQYYLDHTTLPKKRKASNTRKNNRNNRGTRRGKK